MNLSLILLNSIPVLIFSAFALFLHGFFPLKNSLSGYAVKNNTQFAGADLVQPDELFDKVVVVLIDALRTDFLYEKTYMPFLKARIRAGNDRHFTLRAHPPTVTLPRIKALTTGSIPGFIDIVLNFDSSEIEGDNIISQAYRDGRRIVFYGDDTWIKLFPQHFTDSDGTTSFFVTDYTEVDDNVTRHIDKRLSALDWDMMILHYLGLDHIGHTAGPNSPLVVTKLAEMDEIVQNLYKNLEQKGEDFVLLICGDHGMSDQGSHGGASDREVFVPAVFISPKFGPKDSRWRSSRELLQIDLVPTLSMLMGLPIPNNNLGQSLVDVLDRYTDKDKLSLLYINSQQILKLMEQNVPDFTTERSYELYSHAVQLHESYVTEGVSRKPDASMVIQAYETAMDAMATKISKSLTTYDLYAMIMAVIILLLCLIFVSIQQFTSTNIQYAVGIGPGFLLMGVAVFGHVTVCTSQWYSSSTLCGRSLFSASAVSMIWFIVVYFTHVNLKSLKGLKLHHKKKHLSSIEALLLVGTAGHSLSFISSSFVEEEHQTWYFLSMALYLVIVGHLIVTSLNQNSLKCGKGSVTSVSSWDRDNNDFYDANSTENHSKYEALYNRKLHELSNMEKPRTDRFQTVNAAHDRQVREEREKKKTSRTHDLDPMKIVTVLPWRQISQMIVVMCIGRLLRTVNQTGNKWLNIPDFGDWLIRPENSVALTYLTIGSLLTIGLTKVRCFSVGTALFVVGLAGCHCYRLATGTIQNVFSLTSYEEISKGITEAYFVYGVIVFMNIQSAIKRIWALYNGSLINRHRLWKTKLLVETVETFQLSWILLMTLLLRSHNTVFVAMVTVQEWLLWKYLITEMSLSVWCQTLIWWWYGQVLFFQQGNSNSISTVDVAAGYVGLQDYNPLLVGGLLYCSTYAGPIFSLLTLLKSLLYHVTCVQQDQSTSEEQKGYLSQRLQIAVSQCIMTLTLERTFTLCIYCIVVTVERYHLFVWTVFSPKLLYEGMLTVTCVIFTVILGLIRHCCNLSRH